MKKEDTLLTTEEAARLLRVSPQSIRRWYNEHRIKGQRIGNGKLIRFRLIDIEAFIERGVAK
jgi:excisionase family DNA binding protein